MKSVVGYVSHVRFCQKVVNSFIRNSKIFIFILWWRNYFHARFRRTKMNCLKNVRCAREHWSRVAYVIITSNIMEWPNSHLPTIQNSFLLLLCKPKKIPSAKSLYSFIYYFFKIIFIRVSFFKLIFLYFFFDQLETKNWFMWLWETRKWFVWFFLFIMKLVNAKKKLSVTFITLKL